MVKNPPAMQETQEIQVRSLVRKDPLEKEMATTPVFLPGQIHGQRSLAGYRPQCCKELDTTEATEHLMIPDNLRSREESKNKPLDEKSVNSHSNCEFWNCMILGKKIKHVSEVSHLPEEYLKGVLTCTGS